MEILNIDYNIKLLILKALNTSRTNSLARMKLGIKERHLYDYMKKYNIKLNKTTQRYEENIPRGSLTV